MKYKTWREYHRRIAVIGLIYGCMSTIIMIFNRLYFHVKSETVIFMITATIGIGIFIYCWSGNFKRNIFKRFGRRYEDYIYEAERHAYGRGQNSYNLILAFYENGERKLRYTEPYVGNPNEKLRSTECTVYKWLGKYIETDFYVRHTDNKYQNLDIPISKYHYFKKKRKNG